MKQSLYSFSEYRQHWPQDFESAARELRDIVAHEIVSIHHIGSTAVPGLAAKPIIDILIASKDLAQIDHRSELLLTRGYLAWGEYGLSGRRYFTLDAGDVRVRNVHIYEFGHPDLARHLAFRDYLRANQALCREYEALKRHAFALHPSDIGAYNDLKDAWIKRAERAAGDSRSPDA